MRGPVAFFQELVPSRGFEWGVENSETGALFAEAFTDAGAEAAWES